MDESFYNLSRQLFFEKALKVGETIFQITEVEHYLYDEKHPDVHTHCNPDQKTSNCFYFHRMTNKLPRSYKGGTFACMDLTFGNEDKYYGVLIRGIKNHKTKEIFTGPNNCLKEIFRILETDLKSFTGGELISCSDERMRVVDYSFKDRNVYRGTRINLKKEKDPEYHAKKYRFVIYRSQTPKLKEKTSLELVDPSTTF